MNDSMVQYNDWLRFAPLILTIVGWYFVNRQSNIRETRKEHRNLIDHAKKTILELAEKAVNYHMEEGSKLAPSIKWGFDVLEIELCRIPGYKSNDGELLSIFSEFAEACTGGDFEQEGRVIISLDSQKILEIIRTRNNLLEVIESWFVRAYS